MEESLEIPLNHWTESQLCKESHHTESLNNMETKYLVYNYVFLKTKEAAF